MRRAAAFKRAREVQLGETHEGQVKVVYIKAIECRYNGSKNSRGN